MSASASNALMVAEAATVQMLEAHHAKDRYYTTFASELEASLSGFEKAQDWTDLITSLQQVQKVLLNPRFAKFPLIPTSKVASITGSLSQCMNPGLPSGVHLQTLSVFRLIFSRLETAFLLKDLALYCQSWLSAMYHVAEIVKPAILSLIEVFLLPLGSKLDPALPGLISALLVGVGDNPLAGRRVFIHREEGVSVPSTSFDSTNPIGDEADRMRIHASSVTSKETNSPQSLTISPVANISGNALSSPLASPAASSTFSSQTSSNSSQVSTASEKKHSTALEREGDIQGACASMLITIRSRSDESVFRQTLWRILVFNPRARRSALNFILFANSNRVFWPASFYNSQVDSNEQSEMEANEQGLLGLEEQTLILRALTACLSLSGGDPYLSSRSTESELEVTVQQPFQPRVTNADKVPATESISIAEDLQQQSEEEKSVKDLLFSDEASRTFYIDKATDALIIGRQSELLVIRSTIDVITQLFPIVAESHEQESQQVSSSNVTSRNEVSESNIDSSSLNRQIHSSLLPDEGLGVLCSSVMLTLLRGDPSTNRRVLTWLPPASLTKLGLSHKSERIQLIVFKGLLSIASVAMEALSEISAPQCNRLVDQERSAGKCNERSSGITQFTELIIQNLATDERPCEATLHSRGNSLLVTIMQISRLITKPFEVISYFINANQADGIDCQLESTSPFCMLLLDTFYLCVKFHNFCVHLTKEWEGSNSISNVQSIQHLGISSLRIALAELERSSMFQSLWEVMLLRISTCLDPNSGFTDVNILLHSLETLSYLIEYIPDPLRESLGFISNHDMQRKWTDRLLIQILFTLLRGFARIGTESNSLSDDLKVHDAVLKSIVSIVSLIIPSGDSDYVPIHMLFGESLASEELNTESPQQSICKKISENCTFILKSLTEPNYNGIYASKLGLGVETAMKLAHLSSQCGLYMQRKQWLETSSTLLTRFLTDTPSNTLVSESEAVKSIFAESLSFRDKESDEEILLIVMNHLRLIKHIGKTNEISSSMSQMFPSFQEENEFVSLCEVISEVDLRIPDEEFIFYPQIDSGGSDTRKHLSVCSWMTTNVALRQPLLFTCYLWYLYNEALLENTQVPSLLQLLGTIKRFHFLLGGLISQCKSWPGVSFKRLKILLSSIVSRSVPDNEGDSLTSEFESKMLYTLSNEESSFEESIGKSLVILRAKCRHQILQGAFAFQASLNNDGHRNLELNHLKTWIQEQITVVIPKADGHGHSDDLAWMFDHLIGSMMDPLVSSKRFLLRENEHESKDNHLLLNSSNKYVEHDWIPATRGSADQALKGKKNASCDIFPSSYVMWSRPRYIIKSNMDDSSNWELSLNAMKAMYELFREIPGLLYTLYMLPLPRPFQTPKTLPEEMTLLKKYGPKTQSSFLKLNATLNDEGIYLPWSEFFQPKQRKDHKSISSSKSETTEALRISNGAKLTSPLSAVRAVISTCGQACIVGLSEWLSTLAPDSCQNTEIVRKQALNLLSLIVYSSITFPKHPTIAVITPSSNAGSYVTKATKETPDMLLKFQQDFYYAEACKVKASFSSSPIVAEVVDAEFPDAAKMPISSLSRPNANWCSLNLSALSVHQANIQDILSSMMDRTSCSSVSDQIESPQSSILLTRQEINDEVRAEIVVPLVGPFAYVNVRLFDLITPLILYALQAEHAMYAQAQKMPDESLLKLISVLITMNVHDLTSLFTPALKLCEVEPIGVLPVFHMDAIIAADDDLRNGWENYLSSRGAEASPKYLLPRLSYSMQLVLMLPSNLECNVDWIHNDNSLSGCLYNRTGSLYSNNIPKFTFDQKPHCVSSIEPTLTGLVDSNVLKNTIFSGINTALRSVVFRVLAMTKEDSKAMEADAVNEALMLSRWLWLLLDTFRNARSSLPHLLTSALRVLLGSAQWVWTMAISQFPSGSPLSSAAQSLLLRFNEISSSKDMYFGFDSSFLAHYTSMLEMLIRNVESPPKELASATVESSTVLQLEVGVGVASRLSIIWLELMETSHAMLAFLALPSQVVTDKDIPSAALTEENLFRKREVIPPLYPFGVGMVPSQANQGGRKSLDEVKDSSLRKASMGESARLKADVTSKMFEGVPYSLNAIGGGPQATKSGFSSSWTSSGSNSPQPPMFPSLSIPAGSMQAIALTAHNLALTGVPIFKCSSINKSIDNNNHFGHHLGHNDSWNTVGSSISLERLESLESTLALIWSPNPTDFLKFYDTFDSIPQVGVDVAKSEELKQYEALSAVPGSSRTVQHSEDRDGHTKSSSGGGFFSWLTSFAKASKDDEEAAKSIPKDPTPHLSALITAGMTRVEAGSVGKLVYNPRVIEAPPNVVQLMTKFGVNPSMFKDTKAADTASIANARAVAIHLIPSFIDTLVLGCFLPENPQIMLPKLNATILKVSEVSQQVKQLSDVGQYLRHRALSFLSQFAAVYPRRLISTLALLWSRQDARPHYQEAQIRLKKMSHLVPFERVHFCRKKKGNSKSRLNRYKKDVMKAERQDCEIHNDRLSTLSAAMAAASGLSSSVPTATIDEEVSVGSDRDSKLRSIITPNSCANCILSSKAHSELVAEAIVRGGANPEACIYHLNSTRGEDIEHEGRSASTLLAWNSAPSISEVTPGLIAHPRKVSESHIGISRTINPSAPQEQSPEYSKQGHQYSALPVKYSIIPDDVSGSDSTLKCNHKIPSRVKLPKSMSPGGDDSSLEACLPMAPSQSMVRAVVLDILYGLGSLLPPSLVSQTLIHLFSGLAEMEPGTRTFPSIRQQENVDCNPLYNTQLNQLKLRGLLSCEQSEFASDNKTESLLVDSMNTEVLGHALSRLCDPMWTVLLTSKPSLCFDVEVTHFGISCKPLTTSPTTLCKFQVAPDGGSPLDLLRLVDLPSPDSSVLHLFESYVAYYHPPCLGVGYYMGDAPEPPILQDSVMRKVVSFSSTAKQHVLNFDEVIKSVQCSPIWLSSKQRYIHSDDQGQVLPIPSGLSVGLDVSDRLSRPKFSVSEPFLILSTTWTYTSPEQSERDRRDLILHMRSPCVSKIMSVLLKPLVILANAVLFKPKKQLKSSPSASHGSVMNPRNAEAGTYLSPAQLSGASSAANATVVAAAAANSAGASSTTSASGVTAAAAAIAANAATSTVHLNGFLPGLKSPRPDVLIWLFSIVRIFIHRLIRGHVTLSGFQYRALLSAPPPSPAVSIALAALKNQMNIEQEQLSNSTKGTISSTSSSLRKERHPVALDFSASEDREHSSIPIPRIHVDISGLRGAFSRKSDANEYPVDISSLIPYSSLIYNEEEFSKLAYAIRQKAQSSFSSPLGVVNSSRRISDLVSSISRIIAPQLDTDNESVSTGSKEGNRLWAINPIFTNSISERHPLWQQIQQSSVSGINHPTFSQPLASSMSVNVTRCITNDRLDSELCLGPALSLSNKFGIQQLLLPLPPPPPPRSLIKSSENEAEVDDEIEKEKWKVEQKSQEVNWSLLSPIDTLTATGRASVEAVQSGSLRSLQFMPSLSQVDLFEIQNVILSLSQALSGLALAHGPSATIAKSVYDSKPDAIIDLKSTVKAVEDISRSADDHSNEIKQSTDGSNATLSAIQVTRLPWVSSLGSSMMSPGDVEPDFTQAAIQANSISTSILESLPLTSGNDDSLSSPLSESAAAGSMKNAAYGLCDPLTGSSVGNLPLLTDMFPHLRSQFAFMGDDNSVCDPIERPSLVRTTLKGVASTQYSQSLNNDKGETTITSVKVEYPQYTPSESALNYLRHIPQRFLRQALIHTFAENPWLSTSCELSGHNSLFANLLHDKRSSSSAQNIPQHLMSLISSSRHSNGATLKVLQPEFEVLPLLNETNNFKVFMERIEEAWQSTRDILGGKHGHNSKIEEESGIVNACDVFVSIRRMRMPTPHILWSVNPSLKRNSTTFSTYQLTRFELAQKLRLCLHPEEATATSSIEDLEAVPGGVSLAWLGLGAADESLAADLPDSFTSTWDADCDSDSDEEVLYHYENNGDNCLRSKGASKVSHIDSESPVGNAHEFEDHYLELNELNTLGELQLSTNPKHSNFTSVTDPIAEFKKNLLDEIIRYSTPIENVDGGVSITSQQAPLLPVSGKAAIGSALYDVLSLPSVTSKHLINQTLGSSSCGAPLKHHNSWYTDRRISNDEERAALAYSRLVFSSNVSGDSNERELEQDNGVNLLSLKHVHWALAHLYESPKALLFSSLISSTVAPFNLRKCDPLDIVANWIISNSSRCITSDDDHSSTEISQRLRCTLLSETGVKRYQAQTWYATSNESYSSLSTLGSPSFEGTFAIASLTMFRKSQAALAAQALQYGLVSLLETAFLPTISPLGALLESAIVHCPLIPQPSRVNVKIPRSSISQPPPQRLGDPEKQREFGTIVKADAILGSVTDQASAIFDLAQAKSQANDNESSASRPSRVKFSQNQMRIVVAQHTAWIEAVKDTLESYYSIPLPGTYEIVPLGETAFVRQYQPNLVQSYHSRQQALARRIAVDYGRLARAISTVIYPLLPHIASPLPLSFRNIYSESRRFMMSLSFPGISNDPNNKVASFKNSNILSIPIRLRSTSLARWIECQSVITSILMTVSKLTRGARAAAISNTDWSGKVMSTFMAPGFFAVPRLHLDIWNSLLRRCFFGGLTAYPSMNSVLPSPAAIESMMNSSKSVGANYVSEKDRLDLGSVTGMSSQSQGTGGSVDRNTFLSIFNIFSSSNENDTTSLNDRVKLQDLSVTALGLFTFSMLARSRERDKFYNTSGASHSAHVTLAPRPTTPYRPSASNPHLRVVPPGTGVSASPSSTPSRDLKMLIAQNPRPYLCLSMLNCGLSDIRRREQIANLAQKSLPTGGWKLFSSSSARTNEYIERARVLKRLAYAVYVCEVDAHIQSLPQLVSAFVDALRMSLQAHPLAFLIHANAMIGLRCLVIRTSSRHLQHVWSAIFAECNSVLRILLAATVSASALGCGVSSSLFGVRGDSYSSLPTSTARDIITPSGTVDLTSPQLLKLPGFLSLLLECCKAIDLALLLSPNTFFSQSWQFCGTRPDLVPEELHVATQENLPALLYLKRQKETSKTKSSVSNEVTHFHPASETLHIFDILVEVFDAPSTKRSASRAIHEKLLYNSWFMHRSSQAARENNLCALIRPIIKVTKISQIEELTFFFHVLQSTLSVSSPFIFRSRYEKGVSRPLSNPKDLLLTRQVANTTAGHAPYETEDSGTSLKFNDVSGPALNLGSALATMASFPSSVSHYLFTSDIEKSSSFRTSLSPAVSNAPSRESRILISKPTPRPTLEASRISLGNAIEIQRGPSSLPSLSSQSSLEGGTAVLAIHELIRHQQGKLLATSKTSHSGNNTEDSRIRLDDTAVIGSALQGPDMSFISWLLLYDFMEPLDLTES